MMKARLNVAQIKENPEPVLFSYSCNADETGNETGAGTETGTLDENRFYGKWRRKAALDAERSLICTAASENFGKKMFESGSLWPVWNGLHLTFL